MTPLSCTSLRLFAGLSLCAGTLCPGATHEPPPAVRIHDIQGAGHVSPLAGMAVAGVPGIVTAVRGHGFYMEDWLPDADPATSEGIFVFTSAPPGVIVGQHVRVSGTVNEFRPGGSHGFANLATTEITGAAIAAGGAAPGSALPPPTLIGRGGRIPPRRLIADPAPGGNVEGGGGFSPATRGIDFYESLEGMRVTMSDAVATGPTSAFGEVPVIGDIGADAGPRTARGGMRITPADFNPERVHLDDGLIGAGAMPKVNVGDRFPHVCGVMDYAFGNFKLLLSQVPAVLAGGLAREATTLQGDASRLALASFNVENLDPSDGAARFGALAAQIVTHLRSPDIVALTEVQDASGAINDGVVDASATLRMLVDAIRAAGGPSYRWRQIDPVDSHDGGEPGGNIRPVFLFNPHRVGFVDRPGGNATTAVAVVGGANGPTLSISPGRIAPAHGAFADSRKPLAGEFLFHGLRLFLIAVHFNSKGGDAPLFGRFQPPVLASERQRSAQATLVASFVSSLHAFDPHAQVVVLGDLNDFEFSRPLAILKNAGLADLVERLPAEERYTYVFEGNSQALDHILVSRSLEASAAAEVDVVHVNAEFADQASDHDPLVARLLLPRR